jgi:hypothetical protein
LRAVDHQDWGALRRGEQGVELAAELNAPPKEPCLLVCDGLKVAEGELREQALINAWESVRSLALAVEAPGLYRGQVRGNMTLKRPLRAVTAR